MERTSRQIGADHYYKISEGETKKERCSDEPTAIRSKLGWTLCGTIKGQQHPTTTAMFSTVDVKEATISLKHFWDLESIGIVDDKGQTKSIEEVDAIALFKEGLSYDGQRYQVSIQWERNHPKLEDNYHQAVQRLKSMENNLKGDEIKRQDYSEAITQYAREGFAEEVKPENIHQSENKL